MFKLLQLLFEIRHKFLVNQDPSFGYTEVSRVRSLLKQGDFGAVKSIYKRISSDQRSALIDAICRTEKNAHALKLWIMTEPDCAVGNLFNGVLWTHTAWVARTGKRAKEVTEQQAQTFFEHLERAFEYLKLSMRDNDADAEPYARMLRVLMGLSETLEIVYEYYDEMIRIDAEHLVGHLFMLNAISSKWLGSQEEMFDFTNKVVSKLNKGSLLYLLVPAAHTEVWLDKVRDDASVNHFREDHVKHEIRNAYNNSVLSGQLKSSQLRPLIHNYFCFAFCQMGDAKLASTERQAFGKHVSLAPWVYEGIYSPREVDKFIVSSMKQ